jgi:CheY-like chemotaxis protein
MAMRVLVVVDLVMPIMNGLEVLRRLRAINRDTRLVALTGKLLDVDAVLHEAGIPLVRKPIVTAADASTMIDAR